MDFQKYLGKTVAQRVIPMVDFTNTMTEGTYVEQLELTRQTPNANICYYGVMLFGDKENLDPITGKFSLWR